MRYPTNNDLPPLAGYKFAVGLSSIALFGYAVMVVSKASASVTMLDQIQNPAEGSPELGYMFPFAQGTVDVATIMLIVSGMSVIRGTSRQSTSAFRLASVAAVLHVALSYPSVVGNLETMKENELWHTGKFPTNIIARDGYGCSNFIYLYFAQYYSEVLPTQDHASAFCRDVKFAGYAQMLIFGVMHLQIFACLFVYKKNKGRPTDIYDPAPPTAPNAEPLLRNNNNVLIVGSSKI